MTVRGHSTRQKIWCLRLFFESYFGAGFWLFVCDFNFGIFYPVTVKNRKAIDYFAQGDPMSRANAWILANDT